MKIFLLKKNIPLNGHMFFRMKPYQMKIIFLSNENIFFYQMKIYFIEWKCIFYRITVFHQVKIYFYGMKVLLFNANIFSLNENNFYRILLHFGNHSSITVLSRLF